MLCIEVSGGIEQVSPQGSSSGFDDWISSSLDVFKGIFIVFMLAEHTRSSFGMGMSSKEPIMQFVSQVACSLDMTCFSTAYGFSCYRAYLTTTKGRSPAHQLKRIFRSVGLIVAALWMCNIIFELGVLRNPPTWANIRKIFMFEVLYWDFLATFPAMLLIAFLTTKPLMSFASRSGFAMRLVVFVVLLGWPMLASGWALDVCPTLSSKYAAIFVGCVKRSMGAMRFSAFTYMFFFNLGCILSMYTLEFAKSGMKVSSISLSSALRQPHWLAFAVLVGVEVYFVIPLLGAYNSSWEYLNWNGYRRFPMSTPLILAWGFLSQSVAVFALVLTAIARGDICKICSKAPSFARDFARIACSVLEHFGANVLLYLTISNFTINSLFHVEWGQFQESPKRPVGGDVLSLRTWEWIVLGAAVGQILLVQLIRYLILSGRK